MLFCLFCNEIGEIKSQHRLTSVTVSKLWLAILQRQAFLVYGVYSVPVKVKKMIFFKQKKEHYTCIHLRSVWSFYPCLRVKTPILGNLKFTVLVDEFMVIFNMQSVFMQYQQKMIRWYVNSICINTIRQILPQTKVKPLLRGYEIYNFGR